MAEYELPEMTEEFMMLVPQQRALVNRLMSAGTIVGLALSADRSRMWITLVAQSEHDASEVLASFPIAPYVNVTITELLFHEQPHLNITHFSLN